jgi:DNA-binding MarR family transcriptional regulator
MTSRSSSSKIAAWRSFLEAHAALVGVLEEELERAQHLPLTWYDVLVQLSSAPSGKLRMQELARRVLLSKSGITRLCMRMEEAGLLERQPCPQDQRGTLAALTPAGVAALRRASPVHLQGIEDHFAHLVSEEEAQVLQTVFGRVLAARSAGKDVKPAQPNGTAAAPALP